MINNLRNNQKAKICTVYHNYNLSTKNFDGNLLYQLFLASSNIDRTSFAISKPQVRCETKTQSRRSVQTGYKSEVYRQLQTVKSSQKSNKILKLIVTEYNRRRQSTQLNLHKQQEPIFCKKGEEAQYRASIQQKLWRSTQTQKNNQENGAGEIRNKSRAAYRFQRASSRIGKREQKLKIQDFVKPETITSDPWVQGKLGGFSAQYISVISGSKRVYSYDGDKVRQIASLTKIMTCMTALYLSKKFSIDIKTQQVKVSRRASILNGTSAGLITGDVLSLYDLLYAMMLPSGNDAAQAISDFFDKFIREKDQTAKNLEGNEQQTKNKQGSDLFVTEMNRLSQCIKMKNTHFDNPHGLSNPNNYSTANDVAELCLYSMKNAEFRQIVRCKEYEAKVYSSRQKMKKNIKWQNTNKLLSLDYCNGIKTGITPSAGPCMAASFEKESTNVIVVILNSKSKSKRFQEVKALYEWAEKYIDTPN